MRSPTRLSPRFPGLCCSRLGPFRLPHCQGTLIEAQEGRIGEWLWGPRCRLSKSFYTHSQEVGGGRYYPHSLLGGKVT